MLLLFCSVLLVGADSGQNGKRGEELITVEGGGKNAFERIE